MNKNIKEIISALPDLLFKYIPFYIYSRIVKKEQLWLITERPSDARDNGWVLFKWLRENHPEINAVYAIHRNAPDYANVENLGDVVEYGSWKHWKTFMTCSITCSTSWGLGIPTPMCYLLMRNILPPISKRVFLQHGITKDYMPQGRKQKLHADIFVCGAKPEWEYINSTFGYTDNEVKYLGFCRFDRLVNTSQNRQILYMPTWRGYLNDVTIFEETGYYKTIASLLGSDRLNEYLANTNTEFVFFVHPRFKDRKGCFTKFSNKKIKVLNNDDFDLQKLICSANLLITDFSSIYFDFAYQEKPVIYYHFDYEEYRKGHYAEGYFSYEKDGFGPIVNRENELIDAIITISENDWKTPSNYSVRAERFFPLRDKHNCFRHYEALCELEKK